METPGQMNELEGLALEHDVIGLHRHHALALCLSMIFSENRFPLFRIMLEVSRKICP